MLIPNKFNGYQADGRRLLPVGGGVGEAALLGAAMGGGASALTGGDPLKGALIGGLTGGAGAGIFGGAAGAAPAAAEASLLPAGQSFAQASQAANAAKIAAQTAATTQAPTVALNTAMQGASPIASSLGLPGTSIPSTFVATAPGATATQGIDALMRNAMASSSGAGAAGATGAGAAIPTTGGTFTEGMARFAQNPIASIKANPFTAGASALAGAVGSREKEVGPDTGYSGPLSRFKYNPDIYRPQFAEGGIASLTDMPVERMSDRNQIETLMATGGQMYAEGGISSLGSYSDGGRMLKGPGDGMSDSIPASIAGKRPARLATDEFVVPADVVSHLGNGSSDAGAKQLYAMMDRVRKARTGTRRQGRQINPRRVMPA